MSLRHILLHPDPRLKTVCKPVGAIDDTILRLPSMANCQVLENTANRRANALIDASKQQQIELDRITEHGRRDGARVD